MRGDTYVRSFRRTLFLIVVAIFLGSCQAPIGSGGSVETARALSSNSIPEVMDWVTGYPYAAGDIAGYQGVAYICQLAHTSQSAWAPPLTPVLWRALTSAPLSPPAAPGSLVVVSISAQKVAAYWEAKVTATSYELLVDGVLYQTTGPAYELTGLAAGSGWAGSPHTYYVRSVNAAGRSAWTPAVTSTLPLPFDGVQIDREGGGNLVFTVSAGNRIDQLNIEVTRKDFHDYHAVLGIFAGADYQSVGIAGVPQAIQMIQNVLSQRVILQGTYVPPSLPSGSWLSMSAVAGAEKVNITNIAVRDSLAPLEQVVRFLLQQ